LTPEISEFSYGFALTHELVGRLGTLHAAPIFPSLIEEGKAGGGYDVKLDAPAVIMYLQFKRADCMVGKNTKEISSGTGIQLPFYRMKITESKRSAQHELLMALDTGEDEVFYVAPRFHTPSELNSAWLSGTVESRSFFIRPRDIGHLNDKPHHVAFDERTHFLCSTPKPVDGIFGDSIGEILQEKLRNTTRSIKDGLITEALARASAAQRASQDRQINIPSLDDLKGRSPQGSEIKSNGLGKKLANVKDNLDTYRRPIKTNPLPNPRPPRSEEERELRDLATIALRTFGCQLFVLQSN